MRITKVIAAVAAVIALNATMYVATATTDASPVPVGSVIWEDGSWTAPNGDTGCIAGQLCED